VAFLAAFDAPTGEPGCDRRNSSTTAPQALMLMNSDFVLRQAGYFARRLLCEIPPGAAGGPAFLRERRISRAWQLAYQRPPDGEELEAARRFIAGRRPRPPAPGETDPELAALTDLCQQLLSSNEFLYVD
jgi:hypothetical protein